MTKLKLPWSNQRSSQAVLAGQSSYIQHVDNATLLPWALDNKTAVRRGEYTAAVETT